MNKIWIILLITVLSIISCKKDPVIELPAETMGTPVFTNNSLLDGNVLNLVAGDEDYYMYTEWTKDANDVHTFIGRFAEENCETNCKESLQFEIRDISPNTSTPNMSLALPVGGIAAQNTASPLNEAVIQVQFDLNTDVVDPSQIIWRFDESQSAGTRYDVTSTVYNFNKSGLYTPNCIVKSEDDLVSAQTRFLDFNLNYDCGGGYTVTELADDKVELSAITEGSSNAIDYLWFLGTDLVFDKTVVIDKSSIDQSLDYTLGITYDDGCYSEMTRKMKVDDDGTVVYTTSNFDYEIIQEIENGTQLQLGKFAIQYTDTSGKVYRSDREEQPQSSSFEILAIEDYDNNEKGQKTKKISIKYKSNLFAEDGTSLQIDDGIATIAVAYPD